MNRSLRSARPTSLTVDRFTITTATGRVVTGAVKGSGGETITPVDECGEDESPTQVCERCIECAGDVIEAFAVAFGGSETEARAT